ncbi:MAG: winged helix-turn-helix transcriptional regulator, partial [Eubacterium aggregans]
MWILWWVARIFPLSVSMGMVIKHRFLSMGIGPFSMAQIKENYSCVLQLSNDLIGGKWKLRILWHVLKGENRFSSLLKGIPDITKK